MKENVDLKKYNTYGIGGTARYLYEPKNVDELESVIDKLNSNNIKWYILGSGSNVILPDEDFNGAIILLKNMQNINIYDDVVVSDCGINLSVLITNMLDLGYTNLAPLMGIPGTLGGALIGNAGCNGMEIYDDLINIKVLNEDGEVEIISKDKIKYEYRNTEFKNSNKILLNASFKLSKGNINEAKELIKENLLKRKERQPLEYKNAGSVFKNPNNYSAGFLIEQAGLKGYKCGDAMISTKHANFIINLGNAKSSDIISLINIVKEKVYELFKIELELEQIIVKW